MKNFGMREGQRYTNVPRLAIPGTPQSLGRSGKPIREGICLQALLYFAIGPGRSPVFTEDRDADHADIAHVAILFPRVPSHEIITFPSVAPFE